MVLGFARPLRDKTMDDKLFKHSLLWFRKSAILRIEIIDEKSWKILVMFLTNQDFMKIAKVLSQEMREFYKLDLINFKAPVQFTVSYSYPFLRFVSKTDI